MRFCCTGTAAAPSTVRLECTEGPTAWSRPTGWSPTPGTGGRYRHRRLTRREVRPGGQSSTG